jgi:DNA replication protein DnaC
MRLSTKRNSRSKGRFKIEVEITVATVDRLLHHAHLVLTKGDSHRLAEALAGTGVTPLT